MCFGNEESTKCSAVSCDARFIQSITVGRCITDNLIEKLAYFKNGLKVGLSEVWVAHITKLW